MATIADSLNNLIAARKSIISAIKNKGVECSESTKLSALPQKIGKIEAIDSIEIVSANKNHTSNSLTLSKDAYVMVHLCGGTHSSASYSDGTNSLSCGANSEKSAKYRLSKGTKFTVSCSGSYDWWTCCAVTVIYIK